MPTLAVGVRLFARVREICGRRRLSLELPAGADVSDAWAMLVERHPRLTEVRARVLPAVNEEYADWDRGLEDGDEIAFIPPVSGGRDIVAGSVEVEVTETPISAAELRPRVAAPCAGAIATFEGVVRDHHQGKAVDHLEYEAYAAMARRQIEAVAREAVESWPIHAVAIRHRTGRLEIGEVAVAIAVSAAHRAEAFDACRHCIDELKRRAPIWKRETGPDGSQWVEGPEQLPRGDRG